MQPFYRYIWFCLGLSFVLNLILPANAALQLTPNPIVWTEGNVGPGEYAQYSFPYKSSNHYSACVTVISPYATYINLYGSRATFPITSQYDVKSDAFGRQSQCIQINANGNGTYYLSVYGLEPILTRENNFAIYVVKDRISQVPVYLREKLACPFDTSTAHSAYCGALTSSTFARMAAPWGWQDSDSISMPFYPQETNKFHNGVDWYAAPLTAVHAAYGGVIRKIGNLGKDYANNDFCQYIAIEHQIDGKYFTTAYLHIWPSVWENDWVNQYDKIGETCEMHLAGNEPSHLHFAIKTGPFSTDEPNAWVGAMTYDQWLKNAPLFINPDTGTNPGLYLPSSRNSSYTLSSIDTDEDSSTVNPTTFTTTSADISSLVPVAYINPNSDVMTYTDTYSNQLHGVFAGVDGDIYEVTQTNSAWSVIDLSAHVWVPYCAYGTQPFGFNDEVSGMRYVVFTAETGYIWLFSISPTNTVTSTNLSGQISVPYTSTSADPTGYVDPSSGEVFVVFTGGDQHIWRMRLNSLVGVDISLNALPAYPGTNPYAYLDPLTNYHNVIYTATNGRMMLLSSTNGDAYMPLDVTSQAAVDYASSTPFALMDPSTGHCFIYVFGNNHRLYEIHYNRSSWSSRDLTGLTPVPYASAGTTPIATIQPFTGERLISMVGDNQRITVFRATDTAVSSSDLTSQAAVAYAKTGTSAWLAVDADTGAESSLFPGDNARIQYLCHGP